MLSFFKWYREWRKGFWVKHDKYSPWNKVSEGYFEQLLKRNYQPSGVEFEEYN